MKEILEKVQEIISLILDEKKLLHFEDNLIEDVGLNSINYIAVIVNIEEIFEISFPDEALADGVFETVNDLIRMIEKLQKNES